jgi:hypothetical protein
MEKLYKLRVPNPSEVNQYLVFLYRNSNHYCISERTTVKLHLILCCLIFSFIPKMLDAQPASHPGVRVSGQLGFNSQWYSMQSDGAHFIYARRPSDLYRVMIAPVFHAGDFRLPVTIVFSSRQTNTVTFPAPEQTFTQFVQNPLNTFRFAPSYKWATATLGSQVLRHSSFTTGDVKMFGAGLELTPGRWTISVFSGTSQRPIEPDSLRRIPGLFERQFRAARVGYGREEAFHISLNAAHMKDDPASLTVTPLTVRPQEGIATSLVVGMPLLRNVFWRTEVAGSVFTRDTRSGIHQGTKLEQLDPIIDLHHSTRADFAGESSIVYRRSSWGIGLKAVYIGDGFVAPGFPYLQSDRIDFTIDPNLRLFDNKLILQGSFGYRQNNLSNTKLQTTNHALASVNVNLAISDAFGLSARYSNFGIRTGFTYDTLRLEIVSRSFGLSPYLSLPGEKGVHRINTSVSYDEFEDTNLISGQQVTQQSLSSFFNHHYILNDMPLTTSLSVNYLSRLNQLWGLNSFTMQLGSTYRFYNNKMQPSMSLAFNRSSIGDYTPDSAWMIRPGFRYMINRQFTARIDGSIRLYRYGTSRPGTSYTENLFRTALNYRF